MRAESAPARYALLEDAVNRALFPERRPFVFAVLMLSWLIAVYVAAAAAAATIANCPAVLTHGFAPVVLAGVGALLLTRFGWWREVGFRAPHQRQDLWLFWLPLAFAFVPLLLGIHATDPSQILAYLLLAA